MEGDWSMEVVVNFEDDGHRYECRARSQTCFGVPAHPIGGPADGARHEKGRYTRLATILSTREINRFAPERISRLLFLFDGELLDEYGDC